MNSLYVVKEDTFLLEFLLSYFSKRDTQIFLKNHFVFVNGKQISHYHYPLRINDEVSIIKRIGDVSILYEDMDIIIVDKPYHLLTVADLKEKENTLYHKVSNYVKKSNKNNRIFIVHRLDYETSGIVLFAKNQKVKELLQKNWSDVKRGYQAVVHGVLKTGTLKFYLKENNAQRVYVSKKDNDAKEAITSYQVIQNNEHYSLLSIDIKTGRKHQIRVSFKEINHPIVGDSKYGFSDSQKRMYLIANELTFVHPIKKKKIHISIPTPDSFYQLVS